MNSSTDLGAGVGNDVLCRSTNAAVAKIAAAQDNIITLDQLRAAGVGRGAIEHRVRERQMQRLHRGVFLLGAAPPTQMARARAAAFVCGDGASVSHRSAAELWGLLAAGAGDVHVTLAGRNPGSWPGVCVHRVSDLPKAELRVVRGLSITSPGCTICDLAGNEPSGDVEQALTEARVRRMVRDDELFAVIERAPTRKGSALLRKLLRTESDDSYTRSEAERRMFKLLLGAELPFPRKNVLLRGYLVDFLWPDQRLIIEVDSHTFHGHRSAFENDRKRDQVLVAAGYRVIRITWRQLKDEPLAVVARIAQALLVRAA